MPKRIEFLPEPKFIPRDDRVFADIYECGGLTSHQISALHYPLNVPPEQRVFPISKASPSCLQRLLQLYQHRYLDRRDQAKRRGQGTSQYIYYLTKKGVERLARVLDCSVADLPYSPQKKYLSDDFLEHHVLRNDVRVALMLAAPKNQAGIITWYTEKYFKRNPLRTVKTAADGKSKPENLEPDDYFHLHSEQPEAHEYHRFLEIDRGKETGISGGDIYRSWTRKVKLYLVYYESGEYTRRFGSRGLCILTVTTGDKRLTNLKRATEKAGGVGRFWFTTFDQVASETALTGKIWQVAGTDELRSIIW
jgi:Replication-relaxation